MNKQNYWGKLIRGIVCVVILMALQGQDIKSASYSVNASDLENQPSSEQGEYMPGEVLVSFQSEVNFVVAEDNTILRANSNVVMNALKKLGIQKAELLIELTETPDDDFPENLRNLYKLTLSVDQDVLQVVDSLNLLPQVLLAEPNYVYHLASIPPNDTYYSYQWGLHDPYGINIEGAWGITTGDPNVKIAILDSGIDMEHPDLQSKITGAYDFVGNDDYPEDILKHGTHVAGIAAAIGDNNSYIAGVSWGSPIVPLKVCYKVENFPFPDTSKCPADKVVPAIYRAVDIEKVQVINMSFSTSVSGLSSQNLQTALNYAYVKNVTVVAATGNKKPSGSSGPKYPSAHSTVIAVAATNREGKRAYFSNYGPHVDIAAPGVDILSTIPMSGGYGYGTTDGTSQAAPLVSGVAALLYSVLPSGYQRPAVIKRLLVATAIDVQPSGWDQMVGWGRLNAYQAVYEAANPPRLDFYAPLHYSDGADHSAWMTLRIRDTETQKLLYEGRIAQNSEGRPFDPPQLWGIPTGDYDIIIKGPASITKLVSHVRLTAGSTKYIDFTDDGNPLYLTRGGDFNRDDRINALDQERIASVYFTEDWLADLNGDGVVTGKDYIVFLNNWDDNDMGDDYANTLDNIVNQTNNIQARNGSASLSISPSTGTYNVNQEFNAQILIDTAGKSVNGADLVLRYDPLALEVVEIIIGTVLPTNSKTENVVNMGEIIIGAHESTDSSFSGTGTVATVHFRVIAGNTPTTMRVQFRPADTVDSNLAEDGTDQDILGMIGDGKYNLVGTPERSGLGGVFISLGDYLTQMENFIAFRPDLASKILVEALTFEVYYDAEWHTIGTDRNILNGLSTYWHTELVTDQVISLRASILDLNDNTTTFTRDNIFLDRIAPTTILTVPTFLPSDGVFEVLWQGEDNLTGVASYDVQYKDGEEGAWVTWQTTTPLTSASFTGEPGHNYYFQARARDVAGNEEAFSQEYVVLGDPPKIYLPLIMQN